MKDNVARWHAMSEQEQEAVEDPMTVLYQDIELTVSAVQWGAACLCWALGKGGAVHVHEGCIPFQSRCSLLQLC